MAEKSESASFTKEERAAMKERAAELRAEKKAAKGAEKAAANRKAVEDAIAALPPTDREIAEAIHEIVLDAAPDLLPKTWYGMPAYARDDAVVCFVQPAAKFGARYATLGFNDSAALDAGAMWPTAFAVTKLTQAAKKEIRALVTKAAG